MHNTLIQPTSTAGHDRSLLEWFATLTPEQRLAELGSRISIFLSLRPQNEPQLSRVLELLNKYEVEYIVVGSVAAVIQVAPITTFDLDALVRISNDNAGRLFLALDELDAHYREHRSKIKPTKEDILAGGHLLLSTRAGPLDVWGFIGDKDRYDDLAHLSSEVAMTIGKFRVLDLEELIRQKNVTDRPKDCAVIEQLEDALRHNRKKD